MKPALPEGKNREHERSKVISRSLKLYDKDNQLLSLYLQYELFEEKKHEGSERDDLLLGWPWSI